MLVDFGEKASLWEGGKQVVFVSTKGGFALRRLLQQKLQNLLI